MFVSKLFDQNKALIDLAMDLHDRGIIFPDTYVVDMDTLLDNAKKILNEAQSKKIDLYFMLKQLGRNPYIARCLIDIGYKGAVVVDYKEAKRMMEAHIPIANVGHLVQIPYYGIKELVHYGCEYFTVFSYEKIEQINACAQNEACVQKLLLRITESNDVLYSGQEGGFSLEELPSLVDQIKKLKNVKIAGITSFPCFLYDEKKGYIDKTSNLDSLLKAKEILSKKGIEIENLNAPSATCIENLAQMEKNGVNSGEPGHGLSGTTPFHANQEAIEKPCVLYLSEISHNYKGHAFCYGGGHYRRSHVCNALVGKDLNLAKVTPPTNDSIDYYFMLDKEYNINDGVIMAFRYQIFVTRSEVCLIEGLSHNSPVIQGFYSSLGVRHG